jgi:hypothetical protein
MAHLFLTWSFLEKNFTTSGEQFIQVYHLCLLPCSPACSIRVVTFLVNPTFQCLYQQHLPQNPELQRKGNAGTVGMTEKG